MTTPISPEDLDDQEVTVAEHEKDVTVGRFMVFDIGCLECGEASDIVGFFTTTDEAVLRATDAEKEQKEDWHGQHAFVIFDLSDGSKVDYD